MFSDDKGLINCFQAELIIAAVDILNENFCQSIFIIFTGLGRGLQKECRNEFELKCFLRLFVESFKDGLQSGIFISFYEVRKKLTAELFPVAVD